MRSVFEQFLGLREFAQAETIVGYEALDDEIDISPILHRARDMGKEVILTSQSRHGAFPVLPDTPKTLIIVPARAFTLGGQRLGR
jgi:5-formyltetrahydrofolate cyclo-ligase